ncbi:peptide deformylase [Candidatus Woesebacteria bacterium RBG_13_36_22]|uniref:Peptide deformylase n=1 Tax=Candidatus Woesebacteria bacterium RBG_13_36_22 TaxID=1802478 RepID=A0A1F7WZI7_9BACT|nr:MAG: peptide deformylase [Candidatus Woesebacteria bacterium RBG_13_36_22]
MIREILDAQNPILRQKSKPVRKIDKKVKSIIKDLVDTLEAQIDPEGVGLAAPQIGKNITVFIMKPKNEIKVIINPEIIKIRHIQKKKSQDPKKNIMEGCLSLPHYYSPIKRALKVTLKYLDLNGQEKIEDFFKIEAQIIQHEVDHLKGELFVDRILEQKKPLYEYIDGEWEEVEI